VDGHVGVHVAGMRAVDAQLGVPPRQDPRAGVHGHVGHLVRREMLRPPTRSQLAGLEVVQERVQPRLRELLDIVQLLPQLLVVDQLHP